MLELMLEFDMRRTKEFPPVAEYLCAYTYMLAEILNVPFLTVYMTEPR